jgi:hypothetical protein
MKISPFIVERGTIFTSVLLLSLSAASLDILAVRKVGLPLSEQFIRRWAVMCTSDHALIEGLPSVVGKRDPGFKVTM